MNTINNEHITYLISYNVTSISQHIMTNCSSLLTNFKGVDRIFIGRGLHWHSESKAGVCGSCQIYICNALIDYLTAVLESFNLQGIFIYPTHKFPSGHSQSHTLALMYIIKFCY